jgi:hypothetical protein
MENYYVDTIDIVDEHCRHTFIVQRQCCHLPCSIVNIHGWVSLKNPKPGLYWPTPKMTISGLAYFRLLHGGLLGQDRMYS